MGGRDRERDAGIADLVFGAREPLAHRLERHQERGRDLLSRQPAQRAQRKAHLRVERQRRMTAREDQLKPLVQKRRGLVHGVLRLVCKLALQLLGFGRQCPLASDAIDRPIARGGDQPAGRVRGFSVMRPTLCGECECLLGGVLGQSDVAQVADQRRQDAPPLIAEDLLKH